jgi:hypothetical protein
MDIENAIGVSRRHKDDAGSCNACNQSERYLVVTEVRLTTLTFRLCDPCRKSLKRKLRD